MSFQFRPQRRTLAEAMAEVRTFDSWDALQAHLGKEEIVSIEPYPQEGAVDERIGWRTHIVMTSYKGERMVAGFTDGPVDEGEVLTFKGHPFVWDKDKPSRITMIPARRGELIGKLCSKCGFTSDPCSCVEGGR